LWIALGASDGSDGMYRPRDEGARPRETLP
jgi:hypothetical protein